MTSPKNWIQNLALEVETAIYSLPSSQREVYRILTAECINALQKNNKPSHTQNTPSESTTLKNIKTKLNDNDAMITRADKGNSLVIIPTALYESKTDDFIQGNSFQISKANPTKSFQSQVRRVINNGKTLIPPDSKWQHINMIPTAPSIKGLIELHKPGYPVQPVDNWKGAPSYKLARLFTQKIKMLAPLPNTRSFNRQCLI